MKPDEDAAALPVTPTASRSLPALATASLVVTAVSTAAMAIWLIAPGSLRPGIFGPSQAVCARAAGQEAEARARLLTSRNDPYNAMIAASEIKNLQVVLSRCD